MHWDGMFHLERPHVPPWGVLHGSSPRWRRCPPWGGDTWLIHLIIISIVDFTTWIGYDLTLFHYFAWREKCFEISFGYYLRVCWANCWANFSYYILKATLPNPFSWLIYGFLSSWSFVEYLMEGLWKFVRSLLKCEANIFGFFNCYVCLENLQRTCF